MREIKTFQDGTIFNDFEGIKRRIWHLPSYFRVVNFTLYSDLYFALLDERESHEKTRCELGDVQQDIINLKVLLDAEKKARSNCGGEHRDVVTTKIYQSDGDCRGYCLSCDICGARSGLLEPNEQPHESWIKKEGEPER